MKKKTGRLHVLAIHDISREKGNGEGVYYPLPLPPAFTPYSYVLGKGLKDDAPPAFVAAYGTCLLAPFNYDITYAF